MPRFLFQLSVFGAFHVALLAAVICWYEPVSARGFLAATLDKHERLERTGPPRVILVGGSNLPFGVLSEVLESHAGMPVVNMGLYGGLGIDFMLNEAAGSVSRGDLVVLAMEYDLYAGRYHPESLRQIMELRPRAVFDLEPGQIRRVMVGDGAFRVIGGIFERLIPMGRRRDEGELDGVYRRDGFNSRGDLVAHYGRPGRFDYRGGDSDSGGANRKNLPSARVLKRLAAFASMCRERGARCVVSCPPYPCAALEMEGGLIEAIYAQLKEVPGVTVIDRPERHCYPVELFYDTGYHLTEEGARERTARLADDLESWMADEK